MDLLQYQRQYNGVQVEKTEVKWSFQYKGFGLRLNPNGQHKWISYTSVNGKKTYKTIGGMDLPIKAALKAFLAGNHNKYLIDMIEAQKTQSESPLIKDFAPMFIERHLKKIWKNPKEPEYRVHALAKKLGNIRIGELRVEDVEMIKATAPSRAVANSQLRILSTMWKRAAAWGYVKTPNGTIPSNPCTFVKQHQLEPRSNYLASEDFDRLWMALEVDENIPVRCAIQLLCLTGCRKNEILGLKWSDIDYKNGFISISEDRSKNKRSHFIRITPMIHFVLRNVPQDGEHLFTSPNNRDGFIQNIRRPFDRIKERAGVSMDITLHDLRRSVTTYLKSKGHDDKSIAAALNHKSVETTRKHYIQIDTMKRAQIISDMSEKFSLINSGYTDPLFQSSISPSALSSSSSDKRG
jgi:integrase